MHVQGMSLRRTACVWLRLPFGLETDRRWRRFGGEAIRCPGIKHANTVVRDETEAEWKGKMMEV